MFNEAFWIVYFAELLNSLRASGEAPGLALIIVLFMGLYAGAKFLITEGEHKFSRLFRYSIPTLVVLAVLAPPNIAIYAGVTQYVGEAGEVDQTLLRLKRLVDKKLEELEADDQS